jgi:hypothetical protein
MSIRLVFSLSWFQIFSSYFVVMHPQSVFYLGGEIPCSSWLQQIVVVVYILTITIIVNRLTANVIANVLHAWLCKCVVVRCGKKTEI